MSCLSGNQGFIYLRVTTMKDKPILIHHLIDSKNLSLWNEQVIEFDAIYTEIAHEKNRDRR